MQGVSVIIPTYNRAGKIKQSILSVLNQSYNNIEIIIIDDASTDNTREIINELQDDRIIYYRLDNRVGASGARNYGVSLAHNEIIAFQDSDDTWEENKIQLQMDKLKSDKEFALVYCPYLYEKKGKKIKIPSNVFLCEELEGYIYNSLKKCNKIGTPTMILKKDVFNIVGGFNTDLKALEDWDFVLKLSKKYKIGYVNEKLVNANYTENSVSCNMLNTAEAMMHILKTYKDAYSFDNLQYIFNYIVDLKSTKEILYWRDRLVPELVTDTRSFDNLLFIMRQLNESKSYDKLKENINDNSLLKYLKKSNLKKENNILIYGTSNIGVLLFKKLKELGYNKVDITDSNDVILENINVKKKNEIIDNPDCIFVTIKKYIDVSFVKKIWPKSNVINFFDAF